MIEVHLRTMPRSSRVLAVAHSQNFLSPDAQDAEADGESVASFTAHTCMWQTPTNGLVTCTRSISIRHFRFLRKPKIAQSNPARDPLRSESRRRITFRTVKGLAQGRVVSKRNTRTAASLL
jgi:hypothetical protein